MKVLSVVGARPQFIKAAVVSKALAEARMDETLIHTGQHYDFAMSTQFFQELSIAPPAINLGVGSGSHAIQTAKMLELLEPVMTNAAPDWVLVYGDTNSTLAGALCASKCRFRLAHVEAGLRSFNRDMPEEINRLVSDTVSDLLFAPTDAARRNLTREGIDQSRIAQVGDVMYDAVLAYSRSIDERAGLLDRLHLKRGGHILVTIHRAENTNSVKKLNIIVDAIKLISETMEVVWPLHPRTKAVLLENGLLEKLVDTRIKCIEPLGYLDMIRLERSASVIATDSGGVQKEAFFCGVPCVTLRTETEWVELVDLGWNTICPPESAELIATTVFACVGKTGSPAKPYGDGKSSRIIADTLLSFTS